MKLDKLHFAIYKKNVETLYVVVMGFNICTSLCQLGYVFQSSRLICWNYGRMRVLSKISQILAATSCFFRPKHLGVFEWSLHWASVVLRNLNPRYKNLQTFMTSVYSKIYIMIHSLVHSRLDTTNVIYVLWKFHKWWFVPWLFWKGMSA